MQLFIHALPTSKYSGLVKVNGENWTEEERKDIENYLEDKNKFFCNDECVDIGMELSNPERCKEQCEKCKSETN